MDKKESLQRKISVYLYYYYYKALKKQALSRFERDFAHLKVCDQANNKKSIYDMFKTKIRIL